MSADVQPHTEPAEADLIFKVLREAADHPYPGPFTDTDKLREAAERIEAGYAAGGQHTAAQVARVLNAVAALLEGGLDEFGDLP